MPGKPQKKKPHKVNKNIHAVSLGKLGGKEGGPARAKALDANQRREIARQGGLARQAQREKRRS